MINSNKLVQGIGFKGMDYPSRGNGKPLKVYQMWRGLLERCTEKCWTNNPAYIGTTCSDNFKSYSYFYEWCQEQIGFLKKDENNRYWCLDKDILSNGNKVYSEDVCAFVPERMNLLLVKCDSSRGECPIGVYWCKNRKKFRSKCNNGSGKQKCLGYFNTPQEAFLAYKTYKEALIKEVANEYKEQLDSRVYEALMNYEVNEND